MKYITNDECYKTMHSFGNVLNVEKAYTICDAGCEDANHVFFENGEYNRLEEPLVLRCGRNHRASLIVKYKDGSTQQAVLWLFTNCQYAYSSAYGRHHRGPVGSKQKVLYPYCMGWQKISHVRPRPYGIKKPGINIIYKYTPER